MSSIMQSKQMEGQAPLSQAKRAIAHTLNTISESKDKWELLGLGTQSFALLTEAAATLFDEPVEQVRKNFCDMPKR